MIVTVDIDGVPLCDLGGLGFEVTRIWNSQADLQLPDGWSIVIDGEHTRKVMDNNNNWRATQITTSRGKEILWLLTRFSVNENWDVDDCDIVVLDRGDKIATIHSETIDLYDGDEVGFVQRKNDAIAKYFADKPDWRNPLAYWSDNE